MKRRRVYAFLVLSSLVLAGYFVLRAGTGGPVTKARFERLRTGMTLNEVSDVFGGPPTEANGPGAGALNRWEGSQADVWVFADTAGVVYGMSYVETTPIERVRR